MSPRSNIKPLFELEKDFEEEKLLQTKVVVQHDDGSERKVYAPTINGKSMEACIYVANEFLSSICKKLDVEDKPEKLYESFRDLLSGVARTKWDLAATFAEGEEKSMTTFKQHLCSWLLKFFDENKRGDQMEYIENVKKPLKWEVRRFYDRMEEMRRHAELIPPNDPQVTITDKKFKHILFYAHPISFQNAFHSAGFHLHSSSIEEIITYFETAKIAVDDDYSKRFDNGHGGRGRGRGGRNRKGG